MNGLDRKDEGRERARARMGIGRSASQAPSRFHPFLSPCIRWHRNPYRAPSPKPGIQPWSSLMLVTGLVGSASFFIYECTSSRQNRSLTREIMTGAVASVFLGYGSLFLLLASGIYV